MVARVGNHLLGRRDRHRRLRGDAPRHFQRARDQLLVRLEQAVDEAESLGALRGQPVARVAQFAHHRLGQLLGHAVEGADVGHHAEVDFLDHEVGVARRVAQAAGGGHVHAAADAAALHRRDHRERRLGEGIQAGLQFFELFAEFLSPFHAFSRQGARTEHRYVQSGAEMRAGRRQHQRPSPPARARSPAVPSRTPRSSRCAAPGATAAGARRRPRSFNSKHS